MSQITIAECKANAALALKLRDLERSAPVQTQRSPVWVSAITVITTAAFVAAYAAGWLVA